LVEYIIQDGQVQDCWAQQVVVGVDIQWEFLDDFKPIPQAHWAALTLHGTSFLQAEIKRCSLEWWSSVPK
jgi:hypothetical protein